jgi:hypothetical protein
VPKDYKLPTMPFMANFRLADDTEVLRSLSKCFCLPPSGGLHRSNQLSAISCKLEVRFLSKLNRFNMGR